MTPELKIACEVIFQEHKVSAQPLKWGKDAFRGRISFGLSEIAKETLVKKHIILLPGKSKKVFTQLNPDVAAAGSFEEAEKMIVNKESGLVTTATYDAKAYMSNHVYGHSAKPIVKRVEIVKPTPTAEIPEKKIVPLHTTNASAILADTPVIKWYMKPLYLYVVWPILGAAAGVLLSFLLNYAFTELLGHAK
ncbi:MAG TPA: hypothetical protein VGI82_12220 [Chitinophagaceae bacterium]|jgi:hypothetical protein